MINMDCTKENPGYYSDMMNELARADNTSPEKRITYKSIESARKKVHGCFVPFTKMIFDIDGKEMYCTKVEMIGEVKTLIFENFTLPVDDYKKSVQTIVRKSIKEYITQPQSAGSYKNCEGGGWYSMANLYRFNGKYYTDAY